MTRETVFLILLVVLGLFLYWLSGGFSGTGSGTDDWAKFAYICASLTIVAAMLAGWQGKVTDAVRYTLIWLAIGFALVLGYSYRSDVKNAWQRVTGELNPAMPIERTGGQIVIRRGDDEHFYVDVAINNTQIRMLADTGASTIALDLADAKRIGIDVAKLQFTIPTSTAAGMVMSAEVTLDEVRIGSIVRKNVRATVGREMSGSLLGMNFFNTLSKFSIEADELVLID